MQKTVSNNFKYLKGEVTIPADKSMSHRAVILASLAEGKSVIKNFSKGQDPHSTLKILKNLGVNIEILSNSEISVNSNGRLKPSKTVLDAQNSGTTIRLMTGILAGQNFDSVITGDDSLIKRPMKRITEPLTLMGAKIETNEGKAPLKIYGQNLHAINYTSKISSAQVKSCILLAGLGVNDGITTYTEPYLSRNHTEIMLKQMGANIKTEGCTTSISKSELSPINIEIFGDISSAAFFIAAGLLVKNSHLLLKNIGLNPTRTGFLEVIKQMGAEFNILNQRDNCGEIVGDIEVRASELNECTIGGDIIPRLIDEIPIIALMATQATGQTIIKDASDLRNKESDRIKTVVTELKKLGAQIEETTDGMIINGRTKLTGGVEVNSHNDHRLAMMLYVAGLICQKEISITNFDCASISFPEFEKLMESLKI